VFRLEADPRLLTKSRITFVFLIYRLLGWANNCVPDFRISYGGFLEPLCVHHRTTRRSCQSVAASLPLSSPDNEGLYK